MIPYKKRARALRTKKGRSVYRQTLIEGVRLVEDAVASGADITVLYHVQPQPGERLDQVIAMAIARGITCVELSANEIDDLSDTETPQGCVAIAAIPDWKIDDLSGRTGDIVILDGVRDPGNAGTLLRAAEAAGARGALAIGGSVELSNPKVVRSSMGAYFRLPWIENLSVKAAIQTCIDLDTEVCLTNAKSGDAASTIRDANNLAIVIGGEAAGASAEWTDIEHKTICIPMADPVESLNAAVAGAVLLFRHTWRG